MRRFRSRTTTSSMPASCATENGLIIGKASHRGERTAEQALAMPTPNPNGDEIVVLGVFGGGTLFFTVTYDPTERAIVFLDYNVPL